MASRTISAQQLGEELGVLLRCEWSVSRQFGGQISAAVACGLWARGDGDQHFAREHALNLSPVGWELPACSRITLPGSANEVITRPASNQLSLL